VIAHLADNGDAAILGTRSRKQDLLATHSAGGTFLPPSVLHEGFAVSVAPAVPARWQADAEGQRLVLFTSEEAAGFPLRATRFVPGQGWTAPAQIFDGTAFFAPVHEHVTATGDAVVVFRGARAGAPTELFAQCWRQGAWLPSAQALGPSPRRDEVFVSGASGDTIMLRTVNDGGRARAHARLLRLALGRFDDGQFLDEPSATAAALRLFGAPDARAMAVFDRDGAGGAVTVQVPWDAASGRFGAITAAAGDVPRPLALAHDRAGNAVLFDGGAAWHWTQEGALVTRRGNPFALSSTVPVVTSARRVIVVGVRDEQRGGATVEVLRLQSYR
jgi:hypothetical protein